MNKIIEDECKNQEDFEGITNKRLRRCKANTSI